MDEKLPREVLEQILSCLSVRDWISCEQVSSRWREELRRLLSVQHELQIEDRNNLNFFLKNVCYFPQLRDLRISRWLRGDELANVFVNCPRINRLCIKIINPDFSNLPKELRQLDLELHCLVSYEQLSPIPSRCSQSLTDLKLNAFSCDTNNPYDLRSVLSQLPHLRSLSLINCNLRQSNLLGEVTGNLEYLQLQGTSVRITTDIFSDILKEIPTATYLHLDWKACKELCNPTPFEDIKDCKLREIHLNRISIDDNTVKLLSRFHHLTSLNLSIPWKCMKSSRLTPAGLSLLRNLYCATNVKVSLSFPFLDENEREIVNNILPTICLIPGVWRLELPATRWFTDGNGDDELILGEHIRKSPFYSLMKDVLERCKNLTDLIGGAYLLGYRKQLKELPTLRNIEVRCERYSNSSVSVKAFEEAVSSCLMSCSHLNTLVVRGSGPHSLSLSKDGLSKMETKLGGGRFAKLVNLMHCNDSE